MAADLPNYDVKSIFALFCALFGNNWVKQLPELGNTEECIHTPGWSPVRWKEICTTMLIDDSKTLVIFHCFCLCSGTTNET